MDTSTHKNNNTTKHGNTKTTGVETEKALHRADREEERCTKSESGVDLLILTEVQENEGQSAQAKPSLATSSPPIWPAL